jgi:hypothetical protein
MNRWAIFDRPLHGLGYTGSEFGSLTAREKSFDLVRPQSPRRSAGVGMKEKAEEKV